MDPNTVWEGTYISLQIRVNYTPVPLPFRRYNWIHRDWYGSKPTLVTPAGGGCSSPWVAGKQMFLLYLKPYLTRAALAS